MRLSFRRRPLVFVDVEASGLSPGSFPIEIGWSVDDEREPEAFLIRPADGWRETDAYKAAFAIHGVSYADLVARGVPPPDVPGRLERAWTGAFLVSDNPPADAAWIAMAYAALDRPMPWRLHDFDVVLNALIIWSGLSSTEAAAIVIAAERRLPVPHRAGPDARRLHTIARALVDSTWRDMLTDPDAVAAGTPVDAPPTGTGEPP